MTKKQEIFTIQAEGQEWYTASVAAAVLSEKSDREVKPAYLRSLARPPLRKITSMPMPMNDNIMLYLKSDVDNYKVEARGAKAAASMKARSAAAAESKPHQTRAIAE